MCENHSSVFQTEHLSAQYCIFLFKMSSVLLIMIRLISLFIYSYKGLAIKRIVVQRCSKVRTAWRESTLISYSLVITGTKESSDSNDPQDVVVDV